MQGYRVANNTGGNMSDGGAFDQGHLPEKPRTCEYTASQFWLCITVWILIGFVLRSSTWAHLSTVAGWHRVLVLPLEAGALLFALFFGIAGNVIPAQCIEDWMTRSQCRLIRERANSALFIWLAVISVYCAAMFGSSF